MNSLPKYDAKAIVLYHEDWSSNPPEEFPQAAVYAMLTAWSIGDLYKNDLDHIILTTSNCRRDEVSNETKILHTGYADHNKVSDLIRTAMLEFNIKVSHAKMEIHA